eukprot:TRINITY_DN6655_c0_g1_i4.p1 TRINITY_DN6655_c0_g1~~TRINITY_DN6655_c0_g1_i4.p1  ORF type:complete len:190 (-),score=36.41 TRINITY_DN6655_c0_g1_i4:136-705(-)
MSSTSAEQNETMRHFGVLLAEAKAELESKDLRIVELESDVATLHQGLCSSSGWSRQLEVEQATIQADLCSWRGVHLRALHSLQRHACAALLHQWYRSSSQHARDCLAKHLEVINTSSIRTRNTCLQACSDALTPLLHIGSEYSVECGQVTTSLTRLSSLVLQGHFCGAASSHPTASLDGMLMDLSLIHI